MADKTLKGMRADKRADLAKDAQARWSQANDHRKGFEKYWLRDIEDLYAYADAGNRTKFPHESCLRPPWAEWMRRIWLANELPVVTNEEHPIEVGAASPHIPAGSIETNQLLLENELYKAGFYSKLEDFKQEEIGIGTCFFRVFRQTGTRELDVMVPDIIQETQEVIGAKTMRQSVPYPYYGVGIETVSPWDVWLDTGARSFDKALWIQMRRLLTKQEIIAEYPEAKRIPDEKAKVSWKNMPAAASDEDYRQKYDTYSRLNYAGVPHDEKHLPKRYAIMVEWSVAEDHELVYMKDGPVLSYGPLMTPDKRLPFVMNKFLPWGRFTYGRSLNAYVHDLNKAAETLLNMHLDVRAQIIKPKYIVATAGHVEEAELRKGAPGALIHVRRDVNAIKQLEANIPPGTIGMEDFGAVLSLTQVISGITNYTAGANADMAGFNRTASGIMMIQQRGQAAFGLHAERFSRDCLQPLGDKVLDLVHHMTPQAKVMMLVGWTGKTWERKVTWEDLTSDVKCKPKRLRDHAQKAMASQFWTQFVNSNAIQHPAINATEAFKRLFRSMDEPDIAKLVPELTALQMRMKPEVPAAQTATEALGEQAMLVSQGTMPPPLFYQDDAGHLTWHNSFKTMGEYEQLPPDAQTQLEMHMLQHYDFMVNEQQINEMMAVQQQMPAGAPAPGQAAGGAMPLAQMGQGGGGSAQPGMAQGGGPGSIGMPQANIPRGGTM